MTKLQTRTRSTIHQLVKAVVCTLTVLIILQACHSQKRSIDTTPTKAGIGETYGSVTWLITRCDNIIGGRYSYGDATDNTPDGWVTCSYARARLLGSDSYPPPLRIVGNVYSYLFEPGTEQPGCGLYSYLLLPVHDSRAESLLNMVFKIMSFVDRSGLDCKNVNVFHLPTHADRQQTLLSQPQPVSRNKGQVIPASEFYDFELARQLLGQLCIEPPAPLRETCGTDLSRGPYLFTYGAPVSLISPVSPPLLFVDLSKIHENAFGEFVAAYTEQIKRSDFSDRETIDTIRLRLLNIVLTAADWVGPIRGAVADTLHIAMESEQD